MARTELFSRHQPGGVYTFYSAVACPGYIWFVNGATGVDDDTHGTNPDTPFDTVAYAFSSDLMAAGDWLVVAQGHTESVIAAGTITCDIACIRIIGQGWGATRPTITFDTIDSATCIMSAASVTWENFIFKNTMDALAVAFPVTAAYCGFTNCEFIDLGADNTLYWITLSAAADDFKLHNCINKGTDTAGNTAFITIAAASNVEIVGLKSNGDFAAANIDCSAAVIDILIADCYLENLNAVDVNIEGFAASTGWIARCCCEVATDGEVTWINTPGEISLYENYGVNEAGETGMIIGTASTT
jgi:hypothetical protein